MQLIVGLGNPGAEYAQTRHNLGVEVVQAFAKKWNFSFKKENKFHGLFAKGSYKGENLLLLFPLTYMNESGRAVQKVIQYFKVAPQEVLIACDDIAFPLGELKLKSQGSHGGHNGLRSIEQELGSRSYLRLRLGIGQKGGPSLADHVLGKFSQSESEKLKLVIDKGVWALETCLDQSVDKAMNLVNEKAGDKEKREKNKEAPLKKEAQEEL